MVTVLEVGKMLTKARQMIFSHVPGVLSTKNGVEPLIFDKSFNYVFTDLSVFGNKVEDGVGDKSPTNPYELKSVEGNLIVRGNNLFDINSEQFLAFVDTPTTVYVPK